MSKLSDILWAVLHDLTEAQHEANRYSAQLSKKYYGTNKLLSYFPVPNALMDEVEVDLRFAVDRDEIVECSDELKTVPPVPVGVEPSTSELSRLAHAVAAHLGAGLSGAVRHSQGFVDDDTGQKLVSALGAEQGTGSLAGYVYPVLKRMFGNGWPPSEGTRKPGKWHLPFTHPDASGPKDLLSDIEAAVARAIESDPDLKRVLGDPKAVASAVMGQVGDAVLAEAGVLDERLKSLAAEKTRELSMGVIVSAERLNEFHEGVIQRVKIKAKIRNFRWVIITDEGGTVDEKLVPDE